MRQKYASIQTLWRKWWCGGGGGGGGGDDDEDDDDNHDNVFTYLIKRAVNHRKIYYTKRENDNLQLIEK